MIERGRGLKALCLVLTVLIVFSAFTPILACNRQQESEFYFEDTNPNLIKSRDWGGHEAYLLARYAMVECPDGDVEEKMLIMLVVLNRVWDNGFPSTVDKVCIYSRRDFYKPCIPDQDCWEAVYRIQIEGWNESQNALFYVPTWKESEMEFYNENYKYLFTYGNYAYYTYAHEIY